MLNSGRSKKGAPAPGTRGIPHCHGGGRSTALTTPTTRLKKVEVKEYHRRPVSVYERISGLRNVPDYTDLRKLDSRFVRTLISLSAEHLIFHS